MVGYGVRQCGGDDVCSVGRSTPLARSKHTHRPIRQGPSVAARESLGPPNLHTTSTQPLLSIDSSTETIDRSIDRRTQTHTRHTVFYVREGSAGCTKAAAEPRRQAVVTTAAVVRMVVWLGCCWSSVCGCAWGMCGGGVVRVSQYVILIRKEPNPSQMLGRPQQSAPAAAPLFCGAATSTAASLRWELVMLGWWLCLWACKRVPPPAALPAKEKGRGPPLLPLPFKEHTRTTRVRLGRSERVWTSMGSGGPGIRV